MADVFRIIDRFKVTGKGTVYTLKISKDTNLRIGDTLFDLRGNKFKVTGVEMFTRLKGYALPTEEPPIGIMFELVSGVEAKGNILVRELTDINFLFQWFLDLDQSNATSERQANYFRYRIIDKFYDETQSN